jgi:hypothetical protein
MANQLQVKEIETETLKKLRAAFEETFKKELGIEDYYSPGQTTWAIPEIGLTYTSNQSNDELKNYVYEITDTKSFRQADAVLAEEVEIREKGEDVEKTEQKIPEENIPSAAKRESQAAELESREAAIAAAKQKGAEQTQAFLKQQEVRAERVKKELENKKIWARVEESEKPTLVPEDQKAYEKLEKEAKIAPRTLTENLAKEIEKNIPEDIKQNSTEEEVSVYSQNLAASTVANIRVPRVVSPEPEILLALSTSPEVLQKIVSQKEAQNALLQSTSTLAFVKTFPEAFNRGVLETVVGEKVTTLIMGPSYKVTFSDTPEGASYAVNLGQTFLSGETLKNNPLLNVATNEARGRLLDIGKQQFSSYLGSLPTDSFLGRLAARGEFGGIISTLGPAANLGATNAFGSFILRFTPEYAPAVSGLGNLLGLNFGISTIGATAATGVVEAGVATAAGEAVGTAVGVAGGEAAGAAVGAAAGTVVPIVGNIIGAIIGAAAGWVASKIPWKKVLKFSAIALGIGVGLITGLFFGIGTGIAAGAGTTLFSAALGGGLGGLTLGGIGSLIGGVFVAIGGAALGAIGMPILVTLLTFPVVVALILFIINSGAYIVPPALESLSQQNQYIEVTVTASPEGPFQNLGKPQKVTYTITVTAKKKALRGVSIKGDCSIVSKARQKKCRTASINVTGVNIAVGTPYTYTYEDTYGPVDNDSSIINNVTASGVVEGEDKLQTTDGGTSLTIGTPPTDCLKIDGKWPKSYEANMTYAVTYLSSKYSGYISKVCSNPEYKVINLRFSGGRDGNLWGRNYTKDSNFILFYNYLGVQSKDNAVYILAHELGHSIQYGSKTAVIYKQYLNTRGILSEKPYCFYNYGNEDGEPGSERFPEAIALYINPFGCGSVQKNWPINYNFINSHIFR